MPTDREEPAPLSSPGARFTATGPFRSRCHRS